MKTCVLRLALTAVLISGQTAAAARQPTVERASPTEQGAISQLVHSLVDSEAVVTPLQLGRGDTTVCFPQPDSQPIMINMPEPVYPSLAREMDLEDTVLVVAVIKTNGLVAEARVLRRRYALFDELAIDAVLHSNWKPAVLRGRPIVTQAVVPVRFVWVPEH